MVLGNFVRGQWTPGRGAGTPLFDPVTGDELARVSSDGVDFAESLAYGRQVGGPALRALGYAARAALLGKIAEVLSANRAAYFEIALANSGSPETDASMDIDGAVFTLKFFARAGAALGDARYLRDGQAIRIAKDEAFQGLHVALPLQGVAVLINAFNFPAWGLWEKAAPALLSGVPLFVKPATPTAWLTQRMVNDVVAAGVLPHGALSIVCGSAGTLLDNITSDDVVSFTGSAVTAQRIRGHAAVVASGARVNIEADSLNSALLAPDGAPGTPAFDLVVKGVVREMTEKAGQKCTAIRRVLVPAAHHDAVAEAIAARLGKTTVGNPRNKDVRMGPLVSKAQQEDVLRGLRELGRETKTIFDGGPSFVPLDADPARAAFVPPTLLTVNDGAEARAVHDVEVFGPVATLIPYSTPHEAFALARRGRGSLVASVYGNETAFLSEAAIALADAHGRVLVVDAAVGQTHTGHGNVMPNCLHGGPGRAGNGEELGGLRALQFYHRRAAIQAHTSVIDLVNRDAADLRY